MKKGKLIASIFLLLSCALILTACGGNNGGSDTDDGGSDTIAPSVSSTSPENGANYVADDSIITATFNEEMDASTIDATTFTVRTAGSFLTGTVTYETGTRTATFTPSASFASETRYIATITTGVRDLAGNAMVAYYAWSFTCGAGWGKAVLLETDNAGNAAYPEIAMNSSGNAIAVWHQYDDSNRLNVWASRYEIGTGWSTPELIETDNAESAYYARVAMDPSGNAIALWNQWDGTRLNIWANRYEADTGWGTPELIETDDAAGANNHRVAMDPSGNAIAVWEQWDGTRINIWVNRYEPGTGWGTPELIGADATGDAAWPQIAMDPSGNAIAVWHQYDGTRSDIWANRYVAGTGWGTPELIESDEASNAIFPQVAMDSSGNAIAVWEQDADNQSNIWANRYVAGTGWGTPELIEPGYEGLYDGSPQVGMDSSGNAIAVWRQSGGISGDGLGYVENIFANRYVAGLGWGAAEQIDNNYKGSLGYPQLAVDSSGNAIAVWHESNILAKRYVAGTGWGRAEPVNVDSPGRSRYDRPQLAMDSNGNAIVVWQQSDGTEWWNIWAIRYN